MAIRTYKQLAVYIMAANTMARSIPALRQISSVVIINTNRGMVMALAPNTVVRCWSGSKSRNTISAILREKQIKSWLRKRKLALIEVGNPNWFDLSGTLFSRDCRVAYSSSQ